MVKLLLLLLRGKHRLSILDKGRCFPCRHMPVVATYMSCFFCYSVSLWACQSVSIDTLARFSYGHVSIGGESQ